MPTKNRRAADIVWLDWQGSLVGLARKYGRVFVEAPFELKDQIKGFQNASYHGKADGTRQDFLRETFGTVRIWSFPDNPRNRVHLSRCLGQESYPKLPLQDLESSYPLRPHQQEMAQHIITYKRFYEDGDMGVGKTLGVFAAIEHVQPNWVLWVTKNEALVETELQIREWDINVPIHVIPYSQLGKYDVCEPMDGKSPEFLVFDECHQVKNHKTDRWKKCHEALEEHGPEYVVGMTGTCMPHSPNDLWAQFELIMPGYIRENNTYEVEDRLATVVRKKFSNAPDARAVRVVTNDSWCEESIKEWMAEIREGGRMLSHKKEKCIPGLPEKVFRKEYIEPTNALVEAAQAFTAASQHKGSLVMQLRALSDGIFYNTTKEMVTCRCKGKNADCWECEGSGERPKMKRDTHRVACPKVGRYREILGEQERRLVTYAAFTGSVDQLTDISLEGGWDVLRVDGRGWNWLTSDMQRPKIASAKNRAERVDMLYEFQHGGGRVNFVGNADAASTGLTLTAAHTMVFYSLSYNAGSRMQGIDRIHRPGMNLNIPATYIDMMCLPSDESVLDNVTAKMIRQDYSTGIDVTLNQLRNLYGVDYDDYE